MKSEKGITLASLGIYIIIILMALITLATVTTYFRSNVNEFNTKTTIDLEFDKFNLYFIEEVKKTNNEINRAESNETKITFASGNSYEFKENSIFLNDNITIAEKIDECTFTYPTDENDNKTVTVYMKVGDTERTNQYTLSNQTTEDVTNNEDYIYGYKRVEGTNLLTLENSIETNLKDYKIYGNSVQDGEPSPDAPVEIQSVGDRTSNLYNINATSYCARSEYNVSRIPKIENDVLYSGGKSGSFEGAGLYFKIKKNTNYTFSYNLDFNEETEKNRITAVFLFDEIKDGVITYKKGLYPSCNKGKNTITFNSGDAENFMFVAYSDNQYGMAYTNIYLGEETDYEPYGYKIPIEVSGNNLFNMNGEIIETYSTNLSIDGNSIIATSTGTGTYYNAKFKIEDIPAGTTVTLSGEMSASNTNKPRLLFGYYDTATKATTTIKILDENGSVTATIPEKTSNTQVLCLILYANSNGTNASGYYSTYTNIKIEKGSTVTRYESYVEPTTTNIYLEEPLRKIGDYTDYIDFENQKVVRNIYHKIVTGTESIAYSTRSISFINIIPRAYNDSNMTICKSNYYNASDWESLWRKGYSTSNTTTQGIAIIPQFIRVVDMINYPNADTDETQAPAFKTHLAELYSKGTPLIIDYVLETPIEETIELPNISTVNGTTILKINTEIQPSNTEVVYYSK